MDCSDFGYLRYFTVTFTHALPAPILFVYGPPRCLLHLPHATPTRLPHTTIRYLRYTLTHVTTFDTTDYVYHAISPLPVPHDHSAFTHIYGYSRAFVTIYRTPPHTPAVSCFLPRTTPLRFHRKNLHTSRWRFYAPLRCCVRIVTFRVTCPRSPRLLISDYHDSYTVTVRPTVLYRSFTHARCSDPPCRVPFTTV